MLEPIMFCLWLIPSNPAYSRLSSHINDLATQYEARSFQPHVTLFCGETTNKDQMIATAKNIIQNTDSISLPITGVGASPEYYQSVFISFSATSDLNNLFQQAKAQLDPQSQYTLNPHLSLLYQNLPLTQKQSIADKVQSSIKASSITFNKIQVMSYNDEENAEAVKSWQTWYTGDLQ